MPVPPYTLISPSPFGFVDVTRRHPSPVTSAEAARPAAPDAVLMLAATVSAATASPAVNPT